MEEEEASSLLSYLFYSLHQWIDNTTTFTSQIKPAWSWAIAGDLQEQSLSINFYVIFFYQDTSFQKLIYDKDYDIFLW